MASGIIGPALSIIGQMMASKESGKTASAAERTKAAFDTQSAASRQRISDVRRVTAGFIDPNVDVKSGRGTVPDTLKNSGDTFMFALTGGGDLSSPQIAALEDLHQRLGKAQIRV